MIENVTFENVSVELSKSTKWATGLYDLRPCLDYGVEKYRNSGFFIRNAENVTFLNSSVKWGKICDDYAYAVDGGNCPGIEFVRFNGSAAHSGDDSVVIR